MMSELNKQQQQQAVAAAQQQQAQQQQLQQMDGQTIQVQQVQISHDGSQQLHTQQGQVPSSGATMIPTSTMVMGTAQQQQQTMQMQQAMQSMQTQPTIAPMTANQAGATTITTMSTLSQPGATPQMADWPGHGRVQVIQQPLQNPTYLQPVYNAQGQLLMPGNIALHPAGVNQGSIQVIAAGKAFQPGQVPHMLTTAQGKPLVQGQTASFPAGYAAIPTSASNQTLVISQLGVLGQSNLLPQAQAKPQEMQKMMAKGNGAGGATMKGGGGAGQQSVSIGSLVSSQPQAMTTQAQTILQPQILSPIQGAPQAMQFAPWQATFGPTGLPQGLAWAAPGPLQSQAALLTAQGNQIFIRGPQQDQGMFVHNVQQPQQLQPSHTQMGGQQLAKPNQQMELGAAVQQKTVIPKAFSNILPNSVSPQQIRPASSVSTQTGQTQTQAHLHQSSMQAHKPGTKVRVKSALSRLPSMSTQKSDAANQTKTATPTHPLQPKMAITNGAQVVGGSPQDKLMKQAQAAQAQAQAQQMQAQLAAQQQQMQMHLFQQQQAKPQGLQTTGTIMMNNGMATAGDRPVMPVVSMPPGLGPSGHMAPLMGNMIVQMPAGISMQTAVSLASTTQPVQGVQVPQVSQPLVQSQLLKQEEQMAAKDEAAAEAARPGSSGPGRPVVEASPPQQALPAPHQAQAADTTNGPAQPDQASASVKDEKASPETADGGKEPEERAPEREKDKTGSGPPKAMVKPQVLTHVVEGYVIQESSEPFVVNRGLGVNHLGVAEPPRKKQLLDGDRTEGHPTHPREGRDRETAKCETCGKTDLRSKFKKSKRFCSMSCAKSGRVGLFASEDIDKDGKGDKLSDEGRSDDNRDSSGDNSNSTPDAALAAADDGNKVNPLHWTVSEVCDFIRTLPGCSDYVEDFAIQDIDGEALMLLKPDHLMSVMSMKLGPAVKIIAKIDTMRVDNTANAAPQHGAGANTKG